MGTLKIAAKGREVVAQVARHPVQRWFQAHPFAACHGQQQAARSGCERRSGSAAR